MVSDKLRVYDSAKRPPAFVEEWIDLLRYRDLVLQWAARVIKVRYKRSVIGVFWTLLEPLFIMIILTMVFSYAFRIAIKNYPLYVLSGLLMWDFFVRSTTTVVKDIIASENLAHRIYIPLSAFAAANIFAYGFNWLIALVPLMGIALITTHTLSVSIVLLPLVIVLTAVFALGVALFVSTVSVFFHDFSLMYEVLLRAWLYLTPIIYPMDIIPRRFQFLIWMNPLTHYVHLIHQIIVNGQWGSFLSWTLCGLMSLMMFVLGWWFFTGKRDLFIYQF